MRGVRAAFETVFRGEVAIWPAAVTGAAVAVASVLVGDRRGDVRVDVAMVSMAAFLFGLLLAFTIVRTRERLALVQDLVSKGNSSLLSIHQMMAAFEEQRSGAIRDLVDAHLVDQIDYRLVDYAQATGTHLRLTDAIYALEPATRQEEAVYKELLSLCSTMSSDRALIEAAVGQALSPLEWTGLLLLLAVLLALLAVLPGGTAAGAVVVGLLSAALITLMVLLRKLDLLRWHERVTIWEPTTRLFRSMGRHPYVPRDVIANGRYRPTGLVRVVDYPDPYPLRATKVVTVEDLAAGAPTPSAGVAPSANGVRDDAPARR